MSADSYISDEERYADDTFEQESDKEVPEATEIESEISEVSDAEDNERSIVASRTSPITTNQAPSRRNSNYTKISSAPIQTDAVPFDTSSDEEDDVIVGQTLVEINTPSMNFQEEESMSLTIRQPLKYQETQPITSNDELSDSSVSEEESFEDSEEEKEFQKIREMEKRYLLQNSAKTPKNISSGSSNQLQSSEKSKSESSDTESSHDEENEINSNDEESPLQTTSQNTHESNVDPIPELIDKIMEQFTPKPQVPEQIQTDFVEIVNNSLVSLQTQNQETEQIDTIDTDQMPQAYSPQDSIRMTFSFEPNHILSPENIAKAFFDAMSSTNITYAAQQQNFQPKQDVTEEEEKNLPESTEEVNDTHDSNNQNDMSQEQSPEHHETNMEHGDKEIELEYGEKNETTTPLPEDGANNEEDDYEDESYYDTQFEYEITSKTPSCFNSEDYVFHANFIRPTPTTDRFRVKPHPRKSMSFSNERMREIERHNQILLRKILTQKPTYVAKSAQHNKGQTSKTNSQTNIRLTTSAVNRKKQQRQIDLDNQKKFKYRLQTSYSNLYTTYTQQNVERTRTSQPFQRKNEIFFSPS
ncbi:hemingway [Musca autumnalis]|uniref:hemingway n=1 Tax=Musca autumnalis TaxID=221902 RepID=UPI003CE8EFEC